MYVLHLQMFIIYEWDIFNGMHAHFVCLFDFLEVHDLKSFQVTSLIHWAFYLADPLVALLCWVASWSPVPPPSSDPPPT